MYFLKGFIDFLTILFRRPKFLAMIATLLLTVMTVMTVYGVGVVSDVPVYVVDHDNSTVSRSLRLFLDAGPDLKVLGTLDTLEEGEEVLRNGDAAAVVYIPEGLSQSIKTQNSGHVVAYIDGTNMILAKTADKAIQTVVKTASVGVSMIAVNKKGLPKHELMGALQPVNIDVERPFNALTLYSEYLLPVLIFFCLNIFICLMTCACYQEPLPAPIEPHKIRKRFFYLGRLSLVFVLSMLGGLWVYQYGLPRVDIVLQSMPLMALSALFIYVVLTQALFAILNLALPKPIAMSLSYLTCMLSVMFSGLTWPIEMMPWYLQEFTTWIPMTPFLQSVQVFLYHDANWGDLGEFYQMFLKQAVAFAIIIFILMRMKDIKLLCKWGWRKFRGVPAEDAESGASDHAASDLESSSTSADEVAKPLESPSTSADGVAKPLESPSTRTDEVAEPLESPSTRTDEVAKPLESPSTSADEVAKPLESPSTSADEVAKPLESPSTRTDEVAKPLESSSTSADGVTQMDNKKSSGRSRRNKRAKAAREDQP